MLEKAWWDSGSEHGTKSRLSGIRKEAIPHMSRDYVLTTLSSCQTMDLKYTSSKTRAGADEDRDSSKVQVAPQNITRFEISRHSE